MSGIEIITCNDFSVFGDWLESKAVGGRKDRRIILAKMELLKAHGLAWGEEHVRHIDGNLHELKYNAYRLYFRYERPIARFAHYGTKGTQTRDIARAKSIS